VKRPLQGVALRQAGEDCIGSRLHALFARGPPTAANVSALRRSSDFDEFPFDFLLGIGMGDDRLGREKGSALPAWGPPAAERREPLQARFAGANGVGVGLQHGLGAVIAILTVKELQRVWFLHRLGLIDLSGAFGCQVVEATGVRISCGVPFLTGNSRQL
jgi:hypothetical protein